MRDESEIVCIDNADRSRTFWTQLSYFGCLNKWILPACEVRQYNTHFGGWSATKLLTSALRKIQNKRKDLRRSVCIMNVSERLVCSLTSFTLPPHACVELTIHFSRWHLEHTPTYTYNNHYGFHNLHIYTQWSERRLRQPRIFRRWNY